MLSEAEKEVQVHRLKGFLTEAQEKVWKQTDFPSEHRPDYDFLVDHIKIGETYSHIDNPPPNIKPEIKRVSDQVIAQMKAHDDQVKIAWYDSYTRDIIVREKALQLPDFQLRRVLYHEAAADVACRTQIIPPQDYSQKQRELGKHILEQLFDKKRRPRLTDTHISKHGYAETYHLGNYDLGHPVNNNIEMLNEVYPTSFEVITDQILRRGGDILHFDLDVRNHHLADPLQDHPKFSQSLFQLMSAVDWRHILTAFKTGSI